MKRRSFLGRLLGGIAAAPVLAEAAKAEAARPARNVPTLANLRPDPEQRERLLEVTREFLEEQRASVIVAGEPVFFDNPASVTAAEVAREINKQAVGVVASVDVERGVVTIEPA